jgi:hypothetical protein
MKGIYSQKGDAKKSNQLRSVWITYNICIDKKNQAACLKR